MKEKVIKNAAWMIVCKIAQALISLLITMFTARYLGPSNYGVVTYAASVVTFAVPMMQLGLNSVLVRELVLQPEMEGEILGTAIILSELSAFCCIAGIICFSLFANAGEMQTTIVCGLYAVMLIFQAADLVEYWFQFKYLSKYTAVVSLLAYVVVSGYKIFLLASQKMIYWFAVSNALDYLLISLSLLLIYKKIGGGRLKWSWERAKRMFAVSRYYIFSGLMVVIFAQTDRIMLKIMIGDAQTGYYSAAVNCVGATGFLFAAIIDSMRPLILANKQKGQDIYENSVIQLYVLIVYPAVMVSLLLTICAKPVIYLLYGREYASSIMILRILAWYTSFSYYGGAKDVWILSEGKQNYLVFLNAAGAVINVALNYRMIPVFGAAGAAAASLATQFFTNIVMGFLIRPLRHNNILLLKALQPKYAVSFVRQFRIIKKERNNQ